MNFSIIAYSGESCHRFRSKAAICFLLAFDNFKLMGGQFSAGYRFKIAGQILTIRAQFSSLDPFGKGDKNLASVGMGFLF
jgi:hypothetical protein